MLLWGKYKAMSRKKLLTLLSAGILALGVVVSPGSARVAFAENNETSLEAEATENATEEASEAENEEAQEPELTEAEKAAKEREEARLALQKDPNHIHKYKWVAKMNASESAEGTINYMCPECGKIWYFRPLPAYYAFVGDVAHRIETAPEGETVKVKTSLFINFNKQVMEALAERPDVSLYVSFLDQEYKGNRVSFVIPAGEDTMSLLDENGYAGFLFLGGKYGLTMEEPMKVAETEESAEDAETTESAETVEAAGVAGATGSALDKE